MTAYLELMLTRFSIALETRLNSGTNQSEWKKET
jgi:hypothetical protein